MDEKGCMSPPDIHSEEIVRDRAPFWHFAERIAAGALARHSLAAEKDGVLTNAKVEAVFPGDETAQFKGAFVVKFYSSTPGRVADRPTSCRVCAKRTSRLRARSLAPARFRYCRLR